MSGVIAVRQVLVANAALTTLVPAGRIGAGVLPQGTPLPGISLESVSANDRNLPNPGVTRFVVERVQVTILANDYDSVQAILQAVRKAAADTFPTVAGLMRVTIHTESTGPDFMNEQASIFMRSQDFRVTYSQAR